MNLRIVPDQVRGLGEKEKEILRQLIDIFEYHESKNKIKDKYYEGHITLNDVNLGIALPDSLGNLALGCEWGAKAVDVLAARSRFDGFTGTNGNDVEELQSIMEANRFTSEYMKGCRDELEYGCTFMTLSADKELKCRIRFHSPETAAAKWDGEKNRIGAGMAIIDTVADEKDKATWTASLVNLYTEDAIWVLSRVGTIWNAVRHPHIMGRPLMEPLIWNATSSKPFGRSRLKASVRSLIDDYVRTIANSAIALEFDTTPQKYLLGVTDEQYDAIVGSKFRQYIGSIIASTTNPETGENPVFGQLPQGSLTPHVDKLRMVCTQFSAATGLTVTDVGVINDANPTSSDAILAQSQTLVALAEQLNSGNGESLKIVAKMAKAIARNVSLDALTEDETNIEPRFRNPAMPSVAVTADAAIKIATARQEFASTDVFLEMIGFSSADIRRVKAQEQRVRGARILAEEFADENITE